jgi:hypothetical protein
MALSPTEDDDVHVAQGPYVIGRVGGQGVWWRFCRTIGRAQRTEGEAIWEAVSTAFNRQNKIEQNSPWEE